MIKKITVFLIPCVMATLSDREKLRAKIIAMKNSRKHGASKTTDEKIKSEEKKQPKEKSFRQQEEFGPKKRIKP